MMLALVILGMTALAVLAVLVPLGRRRALREGGEAAVYRDQLDEIERDSARGTIGAPEAEAARVEVARRLIAASEQEKPAEDTGRSARIRRRIVAILALVLLPVFAGTLYLGFGRPDLPDQPLALRDASNPAANSAVDPAAQPLQDLVRKVEEELRKRPDDGQGWEVIAPVYLRAGDAPKAAEAFANAIKYLGPSAEREAGLGEALTLAAQGQVTPEAGAAFARAAKLDPAQPRARFYLGRQAEQAGDNAKAADIYRAMLRDAPADAPWRAMVGQALTVTALGVEGQMPAVDPKQLEGVSSDQRLATIRGMVEGLAARLNSAPDDLGGQLRLIRAWTMMGETDKARAQGDAARAAFTGNPDALRRIGDLLLGLGLEDKPA
jgi:cytochrome c-type biogenesis protein CcmH